MSLYNPIVVIRESGLTIIELELELEHYIFYNVDIDSLFCVFRKIGLIYSTV